MTLFHLAATGRARIPPRHRQLSADPAASRQVSADPDAAMQDMESGSWMEVEIEMESGSWMEMEMETQMEASEALATSTTNIHV
ncbi:hypothetical protein N9L68_04540 [bacterium]|nr:hypothetical protein [bacterium]